MTSYIICAFVSGFLLATVIFWITTRQLQKDWMVEYRRLMGGIDGAMIALDMNNPGNDRGNRHAFKILNDTYRGEQCQEH